MAMSYADKINLMKVMLSGLKANTDKLSKRGLDVAFVKKFEDAYQNVIMLDNEQETLKARLKEKTAMLDRGMEDIEALLSESKKIVKLDIPKERWREFGITDSR